jgi:hypothetical protein
MIKHIRLYGAALGLILSATGAAAATLPLNDGTYMREGTACHEAPFAAQFSYSAGAFSYPHATQCRSVIARHSGRTYAVRETCAAEGDGTPARPDTLTTQYRVLSADRVTLTKAFGADRTPVTYRRCPVAVN